MRVILDEFIGVAGKIVDDYFARITEETLLDSLDQVSADYIQIDSSPPNLPVPSNAFRGIHSKLSTQKRWLGICNDDTFKKGKYQGTANILRKYLGDLLISSYLEVIHDSGYDDPYIQEIENAVIVKSLDFYWKDHLVNMNRLNSAVNVRSFGHRNPLEEYKIDGCRFSISMLSATRRMTIETLLHYWTSPAESDDLFS